MAATAVDTTHGTATLQGISCTTRGTTGMQHFLLLFLVV